MQDNLFKVLFVGDVVGRPGRNALKRSLEAIKKRENILFTIANCENASGGFGITYSAVDEIFSSGVDFITLGNHTWDKREAENFIGEVKNVIRPANFSPLAPGKGYSIIEKNNISLGVISLIGRVFMDNYENPFLIGEKVINEVRQKTSNIIIDFHAEATSEKKALGYFFDGKVSAVLGTHTHVQTADECILRNGTAYITDVGMTGPYDSIIGNNIEDVLTRFLKGLPRRLEVATKDVRIAYVVLTIDKNTGKTFEIRRYIEKIEGV
ncbi:MAG: TIGR00282 family metallophosphoesterase [Thermodesulfovibrio sp.]|nr:TIGR00282 family metallophosphoesterase [Thermodesulfovibrio sp.]